MSPPKAREFSHNATPIWKRLGGLDDWERALLLVMVREEGWPPWGGSVEVLRALTGWDASRALTAFAELESRGLVGVAAIAKPQ